MTKERTTVLELKHPGTNNYYKIVPDLKQLHTQTAESTNTTALNIFEMSNSYETELGGLILKHVWFS